MRALLALTLSLLFWSLPSQAQYFQKDLMKKRQEVKSTSRWTLADWLAQKQKMALMDLWLAMHSSKTFFELDGSYQWGALSSQPTDMSAESKDYDVVHYAGELYFLLFGLEYSHLKSDEDYKEQRALGALRLLGTSQQSTRLNIKYGIRQRTLESGEKWDQPMAAGELELYITSFFGISYEYSHFFEKDSSQSNSLRGHANRASFFMEWGALRAFADYTIEKENESFSSSSLETERKGLTYGLRLYF